MDLASLALVLIYLRLCSHTNRTIHAASNLLRSRFLARAYA